MKKGAYSVPILVMAFMFALSFPKLSFGGLTCLPEVCTGADGEFAPTASVSLQLPESGVFNFTTVTIPAGVTVTFQKNSQNTPVTILATGDVTIGGTISVNGAAASGATPGAGGPGGFSGGIGGYVGTLGFRGQGAGGGSGGLTSGAAGSGGGGGFGATGAAGNLCATYYSGGTANNNCQSTGSGPGGAVYGNAGLVPLIGGSGGGGGAGVTSVSGAGGGGGGAILIASTGTINVTGAITANGGSGAYWGTYMYGSTVSLNAGGGGSGGAVRLVATTISGGGTISANGGGSPYSTTSSHFTYRGGTGGAGRIRLEAWEMIGTITTSPAYSWLEVPAKPYPDSTPSIAITQINGIAVPAGPLGAYRTPDVTLPYNSPTAITVTVTAQNIPIIPIGKTVTVKALPETGNTVVTSSPVALAGSDSLSTAQVPLTISSGISYILSATVTY